jgi:hypothetical protein
MGSRSTWIVGAVVAAVALAVADSGAARIERADAGDRSVARPSQPAAAPQTRSKRRVLRGRKRMKRFVVAKRDTVLVTGTLRVTASQSITIAGRMVVSPGAG